MFKTKYLYAIALFLTIPFICFSQSALDNLMTEKALDCRDVSLNCKRLIGKYYQEDKKDSIDIILNYWEDKCQIDEDLFRIKTLNSISKHSLLLVPEDYNTMWNFVDYQERRALQIEAQTAIKPQYYSYARYKQDKLFDSLTAKIATDLIPEYDSTRIESIITRFYANQIPSVLDSIESTQIINQVGLQKTYLKTTNHYLKLPEWHTAILTGLWIPQGNAKLLGNHAQFGFLVGLKKNKLLFNFNLSFRVGPSKNEYTVRYKDSLQNTTYFFGAYVGGEVCYDVIRTKHVSSYLVGGIAFDGLDVIKTNSTEETGKTIGSLNLNGGIGVRYLWNNRMYLALQTNYQLLNYNNTEGTSLSGNAITINLIFGGFTNYQKENALKRLRYNKAY